MRIKRALCGVLLMAGLAAYAHNFTVPVDGQQLYFSITDKAKRTVAVTYNGKIADKKTNSISGIVEIPSKVTHDSVTYEVTAINPKAFAGAKRLKGIVIPSGVESIGDFAFEGCDSLANVVFPSNPVSFGQGTFFLCPAIKDVTIGSDWKSVDLSMFRWSSNLSKINIPAKTEKIQGVKKLKCLTDISVDPNNGFFFAYDGMLYSKDGKTLYACPRAYSGKVKILEGTETVTPGALIDCIEVNSIDFPQSLKSLSFRETSRMKKLQSILMRPLTPIMTAFLDGKGKFLLQLANDKVDIFILSASKADYVNALANQPGEYAESIHGVPYVVSANEMPTKKNLKGISKFD